MRGDSSGPVAIPHPLLVASQRRFQPAPAAHRVQQKVEHVGDKEDRKRVDVGLALSLHVSVTQHTRSSCLWRDSFADVERRNTAATNEVNDLQFVAVFEVGGFPAWTWDDFKIQLHG